MDDPHDLHRFVAAQGPVYDSVVAELQAGRKQSHWMWFIFPQHRSLGRSSTAIHYGITSKAEASAYWQHALLGQRLRQCCELLLGVHGRSAHEILGSPDDLKLRSSMTLFASAVPDEPLFQRVLDRFYGGQADAATLRLLAS